jgi:hypothetical protein
MATRKKAATKAAGKKAATKRTRTRTRRAPIAMPQSVRSAAFASLARFEEALGDTEGIGLNTLNTRQLKSGGFQKTARIEMDGKAYRAVAVVRLREASLNGGRRRRRNQAEETEEE